MILAFQLFGTFTSEGSSNAQKTRGNLEALATVIGYSGYPALGCPPQDFCQCSQAMRAYTIDREYLDNVRYFGCGIFTEHNVAQIRGFILT